MNIEKRYLSNEELFPSVIEFLNMGKTVTLSVRGNSMRPFIEATKNSIILQKMPHYEVGDIVLGDLGNNHFVIHRMYEKNADKITLMGDGNCKGVEQLREDHILAKCIGIIKNKNGHIRKTSGVIWNLCSKIWRLLLPIRRYLLAIYRLLFLGYLRNRIPE